MAEEFDIEAMLEAPFSKKDASTKSSRENDSGRSSKKSKKRSRSRSRDQHPRGRSKDKGDRKGHREEKKGRRKSRSKSKEARGGAGGGGGPGAEKKDRKRKSRSRDRRRSPSPLVLGPRREREKLEELTPEERDARTVFCMQLSQRVRARDLEEFFSSVGKVRDVRLIMCNKTRRFKGISYVEFRDPESVALAMGLSGQKLLGIPIVVQHTQAEKNRVGNSMISMMSRGAAGPMRLYVGSLHFNITEDMLRGIFEPFGKIESIQLQMDPETGRSRGYGFVTYRDSEDAKRALDQLNGFELAGRPMKVNTVTEKNEFFQMNPALLDTDETDRAGIDLGATGRLQLMAKLAEGTGMKIPAAAASALNASSQQPLITAAQAAMAQSAAPPIATQCFMLSNMFDPTQESAAFWDIEIRDDVIEECNKHGGVLHVYVDTVSPQGNCYVKCPTIATAVAAVNSLHGRWFAGRVITAAYVPVVNYHSLFPDAMTVTTLLQPNRK